MFCTWNLSVTYTILNKCDIQTRVITLAPPGGRAKPFSLGEKGGDEGACRVVRQTPIISARIGFSWSFRSGMLEH